MEGRTNQPIPIRFRAISRPCSQETFRLDFRRALNSARPIRGASRDPPFARLRYREVRRAAPESEACHPPSRRGRALSGGAEASWRRDCFEGLAMGGLRDMSKKDPSILCVIQKEKIRTLNAEPSGKGEMRRRCPQAGRVSSPARPVSRPNSKRAPVGSHANALTAPSPGARTRISAPSPSRHSKTRPSA